MSYSAGYISSALVYEVLHRPSSGRAAQILTSKLRWASILPIHVISRGIKNIAPVVSSTGVVATTALGVAAMAQGSNDGSAVRATQEMR